MAKKQRSKSYVTPTAKTALRQVILPDYYQSFHCIGPDCEDSCCIGWSVPIDRVTWKRYEACQHETLTPLLQSYVVEETEKPRQNEQAHANIKMLADGRCPFLQTDMLCMIQKELGSDALSNVCASYPRNYNIFGEQLEYSLNLSCPEAARQVLLHPEPIGLVMAEPGADLGARDYITYRAPKNGISNPKQIALMNDLRSLILCILQYRALTLGTRMMVLGFLLDEVARVATKPNFENNADIRQVLSAIVALLVDSSATEAQFEQMPANLPRKLQVITGFVSDFLSTYQPRPRFRECLQAVVLGLLGSEAQGVGGEAAVLARYQHAYETYYLPYIHDKGYILENYLVNEVLTRLFPFTRASYPDLYREMVCNLAIIQVFLVGMAGHYQELTDARVVQLIQSFARMSVHVPAYLDKLSEAFGSKETSSFAELMWMIKES